MYCHRPKKPKKKKQKVKEDPAAKISGPSNAEEAQVMRSVLGFAQPAQSPAATPLALTPSSATTPQSPPPLQAVQPVAAQHAPQQAQQLVAAQQAQQARAPQQAQQPQAAPIQPQQQSTFRFGFAADSPAEATPAAGVSEAPAAAPAAVQEAPQAAAQQALPGPPAASAEAPTDFVARRVFVGGMPFTYEVTAICLLCSSHACLAKACSAMLCKLACLWPVGMAHEDAYGVLPLQASPSLHSLLHC